MLYLVVQQLLTAGPREELTAGPREELLVSVALTLWAADR